MIMSAVSWDGVVQNYENAYEPFTLKFGLSGLRHFGLIGGKTLLDLGAGSGALSLSASSQGAKVTSIDSSSGMISRLMEKHNELNNGEITAQVMDGCSLCFEEDYFDFVISVFALTFFLDRNLAYSQVKRVLKPNGRFALVTWGDMSKNDSYRLFTDACQLSGLVLPSGNPPWYSLCDCDYFATELVNAGFELLKMEAVFHHWEVPHVEWLWKMLPKISPVSASLFESIPQAKLNLLEGEYKSLVIERFGADNIRLSAPANIAILRQK